MGIPAHKLLFAETKCCIDLPDCEHEVSANPSHQYSDGSGGPSIKRTPLGLEPNISDRDKSASNMATIMVDETRVKSRVWTHDQELTLLQNVESHLKSSGGAKDIYVKDIAWTDIAYGDFDEDDVHLTN